MEKQIGAFAWTRNGRGALVRRHGRNMEVLFEDGSTSIIDTLDLFCEEPPDPDDLYNDY